MSQIDTVIFDLDGTLTRVPSPWRHIHERLGLWEGLAQNFFDEWHSGRIGYEEFCRRDVALWKGRDLDELEGLLSEIEVNPHVGSLVGRLEESGVTAFIVSTGFRVVAERIREQFDWSSVRVYANELVTGPDIRINVSADPESPISKKQLVESLMERGDADPNRTLVVSDSPADLEMMAVCRHQLLVSCADDLREVHTILDTALQTQPLVSKARTGV